MRLKTALKYERRICENCSDNASVLFGTVKRVWTLHFGMHYPNICSKCQDVPSELLDVCAESITYDKRITA